MDTCGRLFLRRNHVNDYCLRPGTFDFKCSHLDFFKRNCPWMNNRWSWSFRANMQDSKNRGKITASHSNLAPELSPCCFHADNSSWFMWTVQKDTGIFFRVKTREQKVRFAMRADMHLRNWIRNWTVFTGLQWTSDWRLLLIKWSLLTVGSAWGWVASCLATHAFWTRTLFTVFHAQLSDSGHGEFDTSPKIKINATCRSHNSQNVTARHTLSHQNLISDSKSLF